MTRRVLAAASVFAFAIASLVACGALVGIEDVKLKKDAGGGGDEDVVIDDDVFVPGEGGPQRPNELEVAPGDLHACARKPDGTVKCWGDDRSGQTGTGGGTDGGLLTEPGAVMGISDAVAIASGLKHSCVVHQGGHVSCWGFDNDGQLGNAMSATAPTPVDTLTLMDAVSISAGSNFTCATRTGGGVACWGANNAGQLGTGNTNPSPTPVSVTNLKEATAVACGQLHACAVKRDGSVACWGEGANGQLGQGMAAASPMPVPVTSLPASTALTATERSTCALTQMSTVYCWGANELGQLGNGAANTSPNPSPIVVPNLNDAIAIAGGKNHVCAVRRSGTIVCWGAGAAGQLGDGQSRPDASAPQATFVPVSGITTAIGVGAGGNTSCAPTKMGTIQCWGQNDRGQLGDRTQAGELSPVSVIGYP